MKETQHRIKGRYKDVLIGPDGEIIEEKDWQSNHITTDCDYYLAALLAGKTAPDIKLYYGEDDKTWDSDGTRPQAPEAHENPNTDTNKLGYNVTMYTIINPTEENNKVNIQAALKEDDNKVVVFTCTINGTPSLKLREYSLVGTIKGQTYLINWVGHGLITLDDQVTLKRTIEITFNGATST